MFKNILFATTITSECDDAAKYAFDMAKKYNATLHIFHVFGIPSHGYSRYVVNIKTGKQEDYSEDYDAVVTDEIRKTYADLLEDYDNCKIECTIGVPSTEIGRKVRKAGIDLIIMGAHDQIQDPEAVRYRNVTGDTLQRVAKGARCPVLVISRPYQREFGDIKSVLFGTDFSKASLAAFRFAHRISKFNDCRLHIFNAVDLSTQQFGRAPSQIEVENRIEDAQTKIDEIYVPEMGDFKNYQSAIWEGIPYMEILKYAREKDVDLIVMAHHTGSIFQEKEFFGSVIEQVVLRSICPVASVNRMTVLENYSGFLA